MFYLDTCVAIADDEAGAQDCLRTHGYMAAHRRQWNLGNRVNWSEDLRVTFS